MVNLEVQKVKSAAYYLRCNKGIGISPVVVNVLFGSDTCNYLRSLNGQEPIPPSAEQTLSNAQQLASFCHGCIELNNIIIDHKKLPPVFKTILKNVYKNYQLLTSHLHNKISRSHLVT